MANMLKGQCLGALGDFKKAKDVIFDDGKNLNNKVDKINTELSKINTELSQALYIVSFNPSTGTLTTKSADYAG